MGTQKVDLMKALELFTDIRKHDGAHRCERCGSFNLRIEELRKDCCIECEHVEDYQL